MWYATHQCLTLQIACHIVCDCNVFKLTATGYLRSYIFHINWYRFLTSVTVIMAVWGVCWGTLRKTDGSTTQNKDYLHAHWVSITHFRVYYFMIETLSSHPFEQKMWKIKAVCWTQRSLGARRSSKAQMPSNQTGPITKPLKILNKAKWCQKYEYKTLLHQINWSESALVSYNPYKDNIIWFWLYNVIK